MNVQVEEKFEKTRHVRKPIKLLEYCYNGILVEKTVSSFWLFQRMIFPL